jgi:hypothetical protein
MTDRPISSSGWSWAGKAWLIFWIMLLVATPCLVYFFPDWFAFDRRRRDWRTAGGSIVILSWILGLYGWVVWFRNKRRSQALAGVARELKLTLTPVPAEDDWADFTVFPLFNIGFECEARNLMTGQVGGTATALLDYRFRRSLLAKDVDSKESRKYHQTVAAFWGQSRKLPDFQLVTRESWWTSPTGKNRTPKQCIPDLKIGKVLNDDFLKHFKVGGSDEPALQKFFSPLLMEFFCQHKGWDLESAGGHLLVYQEKRVQPPGRIFDFLEQARRITEAVRERAEAFKH